MTTEHQHPVEQITLIPHYDWMFIVLASEYAKWALTAPPNPAIDPPNASVDEWWWSRVKAQEALAQYAYRAFLTVYGLADDKTNLGLFREFWIKTEIAAATGATTVEWTGPVQAPRTPAPSLAPIPSST